MNSFLLNRAIGSISPLTFHAAQSSRLAHSLEPAPHIRFSSRQSAGTAARENGSVGEDGLSMLDEDEDVHAHHAGVNSLAIDQYDGRLCVVVVLATPYIRLDGALIFLQYPA